jgi:hypothetical protein
MSDSIAMQKLSNTPAVKATKFLELKKKGSRTQGTSIHFGGGKKFSKFFTFSS